MSMCMRNANVPTARSPKKVILVDNQNSFRVGFLINFMVVTMSFQSDIPMFTNGRN